MPTKEEKRTITKLHCFRCGHKWWSTKFQGIEKPRVCPTCHSPYWHSKIPPKVGRPVECAKKEREKLNA